MENGQIHRFRKLLRDLHLDEASKEFAVALGAADASRNRDSLLVVGTPEFEPWHFVAHLADQARATGRTDLMPTWIRWTAPVGARAHLAVTMDRLAAARRGDTVLVIAPNNATEHLLERVNDARHHGGRILTLHHEDRDLEGLADEALGVPLTAPLETFEVVQHVVANGASGRGPLRMRRGKVA